jgi:hypothetical protein
MLIQLVIVETLAPLQISGMCSVDSKMHECIHHYETRSSLCLSCLATALRHPLLPRLPLRMRVASFVCIDAGRSSFLLCVLVGVHGRREVKQRQACSEGMCTPCEFLVPGVGHTRTHTLSCGATHTNLLIIHLDTVAKPGNTEEALGLKGGYSTVQVGTLSSYTGTSMRPTLPESSHSCRSPCVVGGSVVDVCEDGVSHPIKKGKRSIYMCNRVRGASNTYMYTILESQFCSSP